MWQIRLQGWRVGVFWSFSSDFNQGSRRWTDRLNFFLVTFERFLSTARSNRSLGVLFYQFHGRISGICASDGVNSNGCSDLLENSLPNAAPSMKMVSMFYSIVKQWKPKFAISKFNIYICNFNWQRYLFIIHSMNSVLLNWLVLTETFHAD